MAEGNQEHYRRPEPLSPRSPTIPRSSMAAGKHQLGRRSEPGRPARACRRRPWGKRAGRPVSQFDNKTPAQAPRMIAAPSPVPAATMGLGQGATSGSRCPSRSHRRYRSASAVCTSAELVAPPQVSVGCTSVELVALSEAPWARALQPWSHPPRQPITMVLGTRVAYHTRPACARSPQSLLTSRGLPWARSRR